MRKITEQTIEALYEGRAMKRGNMTVRVLPNVSVMELHGNAIAWLYNDPERTLRITNAGWETRTTKERLNGLPGVEISQKSWQWFLNGKEWDGQPIDVK